MRHITSLTTRPCAFAALLAISAAACGGGGGGGEPDAAPPAPDAGDQPPDAMIGDGVAPTVSVAFPPANAWTAVHRITVRGHAGDADGVAAVRVNGVDATSDDGFANWQAEIPLEVYGPNPIVVESVDIGGATDARAAELSVDHSTLILSPFDAAFDTARGRVLLPEAQFDALLAVDLETGARTVVSGPGVGTGPDIQQIGPIALDATGNRVFALDFGRSGVLAIDLTTGDRTIIADGETGSGPILEGAVSIALDSDNARVLVMIAAALLAVDLTSGDRTLLSSAERGDGPALASVLALRLDGTSNRALALLPGEGGTTLLGIDLATGDRTVISDNATSDGPNPQFVASGMAIDETRDRALVAGIDFNAPDGDGIVSDGIYAVDLASGDRTLLSGPGIGDGPRFDIVNGLAVDPAANRAFAFSTNQLDALMSVDLDSGDRVVLTESRLGAGPRIDRTSDIAFDIARERAFVVSNTLSLLSQGLPALYEIDLATGARSIRSGDGVGAGPALASPINVALVPDENRALLVDSGQSALISVALDTGDRTIISGAGVGGGEVPISASLIFDEARARVLTLDTVETAVVAIDLETGAHSILSDQDTGTGELFASPRSLVLDPARSRVLVVENREDAQIIAVDLESGDRQVLAGPTRGAGPALSSLGAAALDGASERLYVLLTGSGYMEIDLRTGDRVLHEDPLLGLGLPTGALFFEAERGNLWGGASVFTLLVMDPITRQSFLVSH